MKKSVILTISLLAAIASIRCGSESSSSQNSLVTATVSPDSILRTRLNKLATHTPDINKFPRSIDDAGGLVVTPAEKWTSGFFPGNLWLAYELTKDDMFKTEAQKWIPLIAPQQYNTNTHDVGFMIYNSIGTAYRITRENQYKDIILEAAKSLSSRFDSKVGVIRSFNPGNWHDWNYPVIIDNMMNLELLYAASKLDGNSAYADIATQHALTTINNHFRDDFSSYHVVDYDGRTGEVINKETYQGYSDDSSWGRGQAWGLYGYTVCYRETKNVLFLDHAESIASYIMTHSSIPEDKIPYWDYHDPNIPNAPRDASAAAISASALFELGILTGKREYADYAEVILSSLKSESYLLKPNYRHPFILNHSTGFLPKPVEKEIDVPIVYADYYFLEALLRSRR